MSKINNECNIYRIPVLLDSLLVGIQHCAMDVFFPHNWHTQTPIGMRRWSTYRHRPRHSSPLDWRQPVMCCGNHLMLWKNSALLLPLKYYYLYVFFWWHYFGFHWTAADGWWGDYMWIDLLGKIKKKYEFNMDFDFFKQFGFVYWNETNWGKSMEWLDLVNLLMMYMITIFYAIYNHLFQTFNQIIVLSTLRLYKIQFSHTNTKDR